MSVCLYVCGYTQTCTYPCVFVFPDRQWTLQIGKNVTLFYNYIVLFWGIRVAFPGESQLWQSRATQPKVRAGCFSVSIIHRTLTWTTGFLTCVHDLFCMHIGYVHSGGTSVDSLVQRAFLGHRVCTEFWLRGKSPTIGTKTWNSWPVSESPIHVLTMLYLP